MTSMSWWLLLGTLPAVLALLVAALAAWGARRWAADTQALRASLETGRRAPHPAHFDMAELSGLPAPVQRYLSLALCHGQAVIAAADITHEGRFNLSPDGQQWRAFTSRQRIVTRGPGLLWDARIALLPGLALHVREGYAHGMGRRRASLQGLLRLADVSGDGDFARGELTRYLAEMAWYPTGWLPSQGVRWQAVDEHSAHATLGDGATSVTLLLRFGADGLIETVSSAGRERIVGHSRVLTPWEVRWSDWQTLHGMTVPMAGEASWLLPAGRQIYCQARITSLACELAHELHAARGASPTRTVARPAVPPGTGTAPGWRVK